MLNNSVSGNSNTSPALRIGSRKIGEGEPVFVIAEAGTAHNGDLEKARILINGARDAGADCAKFQLVIADEIVHPLVGKISLHGGKVSLFRKFRELERSADFYSELKTITENAGLFFLCSPFGLKSLSMLKELHVEALKIASPELNHYPLLKASEDLPLIISTGVSTLADIERSISVTGRERIALLHCITSYPAPETEYNLRIMNGLNNIFGVPVGVSDHSMDPLLIPALSVAMGAGIVEKHITFSNTGDGLDDPIALTPDKFALTVKAIRSAESAGSESTIELYKKEKGHNFIETILGTGRKFLALSEADYYETTNRSIMAVRDIEIGDILSRENCSLLRSEQSMAPGLPPEYMDLISGKRATHPIKNGDGITFNHLLT